MNTSFKTGMLAALASVANIPPFLQRALADGTIGLPSANGKINKLLFIWMRGANDGLNSVIPMRDTSYGPGIRPTLRIDADPGGGYDASGECFDATQYADIGGTLRTANQNTFSYNYGIPLRNGFAALHPALKFLAPVYNAGDLCLIHRVGYPKQSRSHFDSQRYWENGNPNNNVSNDGILYRAMYEGILASPTVANRALTGVSIQSSLPLILRGPERAMTNLSNINRYKLLGVPGIVGLDKAENNVAVANTYPFPDKMNRDLLELHYNNLLGTLPEFELISSLLSMNFVESVATDKDVVPYTLFPISNATNGGYATHGNNANKYVVDTGAYNNSGTGFFNNLKAAALVLNKTDAIIAGTEMGGFDTHATQGRLTGQHPNLNKRIAWAMYGLWKYFMQHPDRCTWDNLLVVTLSEFGRTTIENADQGTDHAEANVMWVAGGSVKGYNSGSPNGTGVFGCSDNEFAGANASLNWVSGPANQGGTVDGSMFGVSDRYLKRIIDYRSALGEIIRKHLGAAPSQMSHIIPGYVTEPELAGQRTKATSKDGTPILGEVGFL